MTTDTPRADSPPKATLFCPECGHRSRYDGDYASTERPDRPLPVSGLSHGDNEPSGVDRTVGDTGHRALDAVDRHRPDAGERLAENGSPELTAAGRRLQLAEFPE